MYRTNLIVMLTKNDFTVKNAYEIFDYCKDRDVKFWGMKDEGLEINELKRIYNYMKENDKTTIMEVVAYSEEEGIEGAKKAIECKCDILMGTKYFESINILCNKNNIKYMPFVGKIDNRPSILSGKIEDIINEATMIEKKGIYGIDLLGYRYVDDSTVLNKRLVSNINIPVCIAGSIDSYKKINEVLETNAWGFTIGSAFFEKKFGDDIKEQINNVLDYIKK